MRRSSLRTQPRPSGLGVTDETFVVAMAEERLTPTFFLGLIVTVYLSWSTGTIIGAVFSTFIPEVLARGMSVGLYAMFIAILVPSARKSWVTLIVAALGGLLTWGLTFVFPSLPYGWRIVIAILAASGCRARRSSSRPTLRRRRPHDLDHHRRHVGRDIRALG